MVAPDSILIEEVVERRNRKWGITGSDVDVAGNDGSGRIAGHAPVRLGVHLLLVILRPERWEHQTPRRLNLINNQSTTYITKALIFGT